MRLLRFFSMGDGVALQMLARSAFGGSAERRAMVRDVFNPTCDGCGHRTVRAKRQFNCLNCGNAMGLDA